MVFTISYKDFMNFQNSETVFVTGRGMKQKSYLISGWILIGVSLILSVIFTSSGYGVVFCGGIVYGITYIVMYFKYQKMTITVSNLKIMGRCVYHSSIFIPLQRVTSLQLKGGSSLWVYYTNDSGRRKVAMFPPMENAEQIYNTIYSLVFPPSVSPQMR